LNVKGSYSFNTDDGHRRTINYIAGADTGFVAEGADIPVASEVAAVVPVVYSAPVEVHPAVVTLTTGPETPAVRNDASYDFKYNNPESSRFEESDSDLNINGGYEYTGDDGVHRTVTYRAGSGIGFVAETSEVGTPSGLYDASALARGTLNNVKFRSADAPELPAPITYAAASQSATLGNDGSYAFSYNAGSSDREESADSNLNVRGQYSFIADDGNRRRINYIAGSDTGFVATGADIPVAPEVAPVAPVVPVIPIVYSASVVPEATKYSGDAAEISNVLNDDGSYKFSYNAGSSDREESADNNLNVRGKYSYIAGDGIRRRINYIAGSKTGFVVEEGNISPAVVAVDPVVAVKAAVIPTVYTAESTGVEASADRSDASYKFGYTTNDSDREESADADLNVEGSFSFVADDGQRRTVNYKAGSATGFIADGTHLPVAHDLPSAAPISSVGTHGSSASAHVTPLLKSAAAVVPAAVEFESKKTGDSSYSFEYANSASSRDESADPALNVKGSFKFVADDGVERTVNYVAGSATGFVAEGTHLPKAGAIPVVPEVLPSLRSAVVPSSPAVTSNADVVNLSTRGSFNEASFRSAVVPSSPAVTSNADVVNLSTRGSFNEASFRSAASHATHDENIVGNVLLRQYPVMPGKTKFGYVFTAV